MPLHRQNGGKSMNFMNKGTAVAPQALLDQREYRAEELERLSKVHPQATLLSFKLNIPGPIKTNDILKTVFEDGLLRIQLSLPDLEIITVSHAVTGPEAILRTAVHSELVKKTMVKLEESSPLARLYDIDVHYGGIAWVRDELGLPPRSCLLCDKPAKVCGRMGTHTLEELLEAVERLILTNR